MWFLSERELFGTRFAMYCFARLKPVQSAQMVEAMRYLWG